LKWAVIAATGLAAAATAALAAPAPAPDRPADGFDHISHQGRVEARAVKPPECAHCTSSTAQAG
jgi:hypothetical protein